MSVWFSAGCKSEETMVPSRTTEPILLLLYLCEITIYLFIRRSGLVISYITQLSRQPTLSVESQWTMDRGKKNNKLQFFWETKKEKSNRDGVCRFSSKSEDSTFYNSTYSTRCVFATFLYRCKNYELHNVLVLPLDWNKSFVIVNIFEMNYILLIVMPFVFGILLVSSFTARM